MHELLYVSEMKMEHRKNYAQFFTPPLVARIMADWISQNKPNTVLDPAFGLGIFYDEMIKIIPKEHMRFTGYEIDDKILSYTNYSCENGINIINADYLEADISLVDGIICNPPYMRFQKFLNRHNVLPIVEKKVGRKLVGYANISSVFLVKSLTELNHNGRLAYIMPLEFFNTGYGKEIKRCLLEKHLLKRIIIFENEKDIFPDATTTVCILLCLNDKVKNKIKVSFIKTKEEMEKISNVNSLEYAEIDPAELPPNKKWSPILLSLFSNQKIPDGFTKISLYGSFKRGIATGANTFFALTKSDIEKYKLNDNIIKCITKSPQIKKAVFTDDDLNVLYEKDKAVYCLNVKEHNDEYVQKYIKIGEEREFHLRYLTRMREPWYKIENRHPAPILFGVFNRGRFKVIRNYSSAINFTCFHGFYPNALFGKAEIDKIFVYLLSDIGQSIIKLNKRAYGKNLDKLEPGDLNDCLCPNQDHFTLIKQVEVEEIIKIAKNDVDKAIEMSNNLMRKITHPPPFGVNDEPK